MKQQSPPRFAQALFDWFCKGAVVEDLKGDMDELFIRNLTRMSASKARWIYWRQVISLIFSYAVKRRKKQRTIQRSSMLPDLSMLSKAETERIWLPFTVWLTAAGALLPAQSRRWWLALNVVGALLLNHFILTNW